MLEIAAPLRRPRLVVLALVTNFVLGPVFAYLSARLVSLLITLEHGYMIGLMIIASAAGSPMLPKWVKLAKGDLGFGVAITVLLMGTSIFYLPLVLPRLISGVNVGTRRMLALGSGQRNIKAVLLVATTSIADPKVLVIAVIAALVIFFMLLGTAGVFVHRMGSPGIRQFPHNPVHPCEAARD